MDIGPSTSLADLPSLQELADLQVIQIAEPLPKQLFEGLERIVFSRRPETTLRVFGFYSTGLEGSLSFLRDMPSLRRLSVEIHGQVTDLESIYSLPRLRSLTLDLFALRSFALLYDLPEDLEELGLGRTKTKNMKLGVLGRFRKLRALRIEGHTRDIEIVGTLTELERLNLQSVTVPSLAFLAPLGKLVWLRIALGGIKNMSALARVGKMSYLELWRVLGLSNVDFVGEMVSLKTLFLQDLNKITKLPSLEKLRSLREVHLDNVRPLRKMEPVAQAPGLELLRVISARHMEPKDFECFVGHPTLKKAFVKFGSDRKNAAIERLLGSSE